MVLLFIAFQGLLSAVNPRSVSCKQVRSVCLSSTRSRGARHCKVGPAGLPQVGRPGGTAIWPPPLHGRPGLLPEVGSCCVARTLTVGGRPASLWPNLALRCADVSLLICAFSKKVVTDLHLLLGCLVGLWINANTFRSICLNRDPILDSDHYECGTMPLDRSRGRVLRGARPTGLGEAARPGFLPISVHFWCTCS